MAPLIDIQNFAKTYIRGKQKVEVLHHVNLAIAGADFLALMGPSGSGKTTLLKLIGGLDTPSAGSISVGGKRIDQLGGGALAKWRASNVGFIFQFHNLMPMLSAQRNVALVQALQVVDIPTGQPAELCRSARPPKVLRCPAMKSLRD